MRLSARVVVFLSLAAVGCGNSVEGGDRGAVLSGTFVGPVSGLRFATASQAGTTDAAGTFAYRVGETVAFSLGGITLGSALAAPKISPFDVFGVTPPTTQSALTTELNGLGFDGFDAALNLTVFLAALDTDHDVTNGVALDGWNEKLAGDSLRFDSDWRTFLTCHFGTIALANAITTVKKTSIAAPVAQLFRALGISFPASYVTHQRSMQGTDPAQSTTYTYDAQYNAISGTTDIDSDGDIDNLTTSAFAANGTITTSQTEYDRDNDGMLDVAYGYVRTLDATGDVTREVDTNDANDGTLNLATVTQTYDGAHRILIQHVDSDAHGDGSIESSSNQRNTYDADGNLTLASTELSVGSDVTETLTTSATFDAQGNQLTYQSLDQATTVTRVRTAATYDTNGRMLTFSAITDGGDGSPVTRRNDTSNTYTADGKYLTSTGMTDSDGDGTPNRKNITTYTYDDAGRTLTYQFDLDSDGNGTIDRRQHTTYTYAGNVRMSVFVGDTNADGTPESRGTAVDTYDAYGNALSSRQTQDDNNDGTDDTVYTSSNTYVQAPDGVFLTLRDAAF